jgi:hypothetical protein
MAPHQSIPRLALTLLLALSAACSEPDKSDGASGATGRASSTAATATPTATASAAATAADAPLGERFAGAAPPGIQRSGQKLGVPNGWQAGEFGEVKTANKDGYAALYDLPQFPPQLSQVELRATSMGCKSAKLEAPVDGGIGAKKVPAKIHQGTCTFEGGPAAVWAIAVNIDKNDNPKVIVVAVKESARATLEKDVPAIVQGYADAW